ncbi:hypothetical protein [Anabaena sp. FACHB-83]|nr:hypothetical protein [Anabaena sp. FACHB-83]
MFFVSRKGKVARWAVYPTCRRALRGFLQSSDYRAEAQKTDI